MRLTAAEFAKLEAKSASATPTKRGKPKGDDPRGRGFNISAEQYLEWGERCDTVTVVTLTDGTTATYRIIEWRRQRK